ncbi:MAG: hydroxymethylbilane synthase [Candidatus Zixiibacteriota bacterium]|nr:MAG: hydroxymethylbilane synthase [candidate division Zixibacteria bacterium]
MKIGTRGSDLAGFQTGVIADKIRKSLGIEIEIEVIKTKGDIVTDRPLREIEGRGYFTKELEEALLDKRIDLAVHSFKDMPSQNPEGLVVACVSEREDPADLLIIKKDSYKPDKGKIPLSENAFVGTSAVRRESQIRALRDDLNVKDLRGNVPTRLRKLSEGLYDAIFLASAGVKRLNLDLSDFEVVRLNPEQFVPSPGQGVLAVQMRIDDPGIEPIRSIIHNQHSYIATSMERDIMAKFGGGCGLPLGAYAYSDKSDWHVYGFWGGIKGKPKWANVNGMDLSKLAEKLYYGLTHD